jgi:hypothetical protein
MAAKAISAIFATRAPAVSDASAAADCISTGNGVRAELSNAPSNPLHTSLAEFAQFFAPRALAEMCVL